MGLLFKPLGGLLVFAGFLAVVAVAVLLTWLLKPLFPESRLKRALFSEYRAGVAGEPARPADCHEDDLPVLRRHPRQ